MSFDSAQLETLLTVIDEGTLERAAKRLHLTPSAVSQRLRALELSAGSVLLTRSKPVRPTETGEVMVRLARAMQLLDHEARAALSGPDGFSVTVRLVANADSLGTWLLPAIVEASRVPGLIVNVIHENENYSHRLLASGAAMAAVSADAARVPGCTTAPLGTMRYIAAAHPALIEEHFAGGFTPAAAESCPYVDFDTKDDYQRSRIAATGGRALAPRHTIPDVHQFCLAVASGLGWGYIPELLWESTRYACSGDQGFDAISGVAPLDVPLYLHRWKLGSEMLDALADALTSTAERSLRRP